MRKPHTAAKLVLCLCLLALAPSPALAVLPWGSVIGGYQTSAGFAPVVAYSNGNWEWYPTRLSGHGKKWQCVEYVNRFYAQAYGLGIEGGDAKNYYSRAAAKGLLAFPNDSAVPPQPGDILCSEGPPYGHVAVVRSVEAEGVHIIQQNWFNDERDLDMVLPLTLKGGLYHLGGFGPKHPICGWLRAPQASTPDDQRVLEVNNAPPAAEPSAEQPTQH
jgi:surface antigen